MINIPTRVRIAVAVCEMVNRRDSPTNGNTGVRVEEAVAAAVEKMSLLGRENGRRNANGNGSGNGRENRVERKPAWNANHRIWTSRRATPHRLRNL